MSQTILTFAILVMSATAAENANSKGLPHLPEGITSFGGAIVDGWLYAYGGHTGVAHEYAIETQSNLLRRLNLKKPNEWETIAKGPRLQGLAMVAYKGSLYRIGGFTAHNKKGEEQDLRSVADFARYNLKSKQWEELPAMPSPRSSHDAVVIGNKLYVAGGWALGTNDPTWHDTAYAVDLSEKQLRWEELPKPPFKRRALALGKLDDKLLVVGGMPEDGKPVTDVGVFDPETGKWTDGPKLIGEGMEGFGSSAWNVGDCLFVSTYSGRLQRLTSRADSWSVVAELETDRFFHRMLPMDKTTLVNVGGASMKTGKFTELEVIDIAKLLTVEPRNEGN